MNSAVKLLVSSLVSIILAGCGYWLVIGREMVSREELVEYVKQHIDYQQERVVIRETLARHDTLIERNTSELSAIRVQLSTLGAKLDILLATVEKLIKQKE